jgi:hypothetical protein
MALEMVGTVVANAPTHAQHISGPFALFAPVRVRREAQRANGAEIH